MALESHFMRILIQDPAGKSYFDGWDWTENMAQAKAFGSVAQAESFCYMQKLRGALIVMKFNNPARVIRYSPNSRNALLVSKPPTTKIKSLS